MTKLFLIFCGLGLRLMSNQEITQESSVHANSQHSKKVVTIFYNLFILLDFVVKEWSEKKNVLTYIFIRNFLLKFAPV